MSEFLHRPSSANGCGLVLTHGAGANCESALLVAVANAFQFAGFHVLRYDLPFRERKRFGPPLPAQAAEDRRGLRAAIRDMRSIVGGPVFAGGHSYGGRQASILVAEETDAADGLLLLSYPLHPPSKPQQLRTAHFPELRMPALFVHGTLDPFGSPDELRQALSLLAGASQLSLVEKAGHDLARGKFDVVGKVVEPFSKVSGRQIAG